MGHEKIRCELTELVKASDKEKAREAVIKKFEKESNGAILISCRIADTIIGE